MQPVRHLYVHFPFCPHVCPYCSFHVLPVHKQQSETVVDLLIQEFETVPGPLELETIFFGGGTPSALSLVGIEKLFRPVTEKLVNNRALEVTCECNPSTLSIQKAELMLKLKV